MCDQTKPSAGIVPQGDTRSSKRVSLNLSLELPNDPYFDTSLWPEVIGMEGKAAAATWGFLAQMIETGRVVSQEGSSCQ